MSAADAVGQSGVCAIYGPDSFLKRSALQRVIKQLDKSLVGDSVLQFSEDADLAVVLDELNTLPMLVPYKVVVIQDADQFISKHRQSLERYCQAPSKTATLILICKSLDARTKLYRAIDKCGTRIECKSPRGAGMIRWISQHAKDVHGATIEQAAALLLQEYVGDDLGMLDSELLKLCTYAGPRRTITVDDVCALVGNAKEETVFAIGDALFDRRPDLALTKWGQTWQTDRAAAQRAVGGLAWALRRMLETKHKSLAGESWQALSRSAFQRPEDLAARLGTRSLQECEHLVSELADAEWQARTGQTDVRSAIEKLCMNCA